MSEQTPRDDLEKWSEWPRLGCDTLRMIADNNPPDWAANPTFPGLLHAAADRIERLERALRDIEKMGLAARQGHLSHMMAAIAEAALKGQEG